MSTTDPPLGSIVDLPIGRGVVRFSGPTQFKAGKWIGVELYEKNGKNDGSIEGVQYFSCKMGYGVFVRGSQIKGIVGNERDVKEEKKPSLVVPSTPVKRPSLGSGAGHKRTGSGAGAGLLRANSNASVTRTASPSSSSARSASPSKPTRPTKPTLNTSTTLASPRIGRTGQASPTKKSFASNSPSLHQPRRSISLRSSPLQQDTPSRTESPAVNGHRRVSSPLAQPSPQSTPPREPVVHSPPPEPQTQPSAPIPEPAVDESELQELRVKIRVLEAKRADDAQHIRELETRLADAESFVSLRPKLQAKLQSLQTELSATKRQLSDTEQLSKVGDERLVEMEERLEMAMLDKEVAEEKAELAETELEELRERVASLEVEVEVLHEERELVEEDSKVERPEKGSLEYIQLEKQNERLKEALVRLRDLSQETDLTQRHRIAEMERDISTLETLQAEYQTLQVKLTNAETQVEDLKLQLDDALGAEDLLVQLTERNLQLGEKIEEMRITIEDLEALKELSDELEENHVETEKALHEDIQSREAQNRTLQSKIDILEEACQDYEHTIGQFRELVLQLQSELETLRTQTATAQSESATASSQTAAVLSMNLKLQSTAVKNQARMIEMECIKIESRERGELLGIIWPYLPQPYLDTDTDATNTYLYFSRMAAKAELINLVTAQAHSLPDSLLASEEEGGGKVSEVMVGICDMRTRLSSLSVLCRRFAAILRYCDAERFLDVGKVYQEIAPLEKRVDMHIDLLRRDEFRAGECVADVAKIHAQFTHLSELYFAGFSYDLGERQLGYVASFDLDLDVFAASIGLARSSVKGIVNEEDTDVVLDMGGFDINTELLEPLQMLLNKGKSAKNVSRKLTKRLEELTRESSALKEHLLPQMEGLSNKVGDLVNFGISLAQQTIKHVADARSASTPFQLTTVISAAKELAAGNSNYKPGTLWWEAVAETISQLTQDGGKLSGNVGGENVVKITGIPPWQSRLSTIKASLAVNLEAEHKLSQLSEEIQGLVRSLKAKDQSIQEYRVKIEMQERRMESAKKQSEMIAELEKELEVKRNQEKEYREGTDTLEREIVKLEEENARLKASEGRADTAPAGAPVAESDAPVVIENLEQGYLIEQNECLRSTVRFLRMENMHLKGHDLLKELEALPPLPLPASLSPRSPTPPLTADEESDDSDDDERPRTPRQPTLRDLATETKLLYRDVMKFSAEPKVVDLSLRKKGVGWIPRKKMPAQQVLDRKLEMERLGRRVRGLVEKASVLR
ncbi:dynactin [Moniliophthora roreri MCA 2997]|uniref:Dynactin n=1 Tax=Moniliophthora roreri (strain MCA 2997) TaxID=1381753 RepID=V2WYA7_MONRO|nr:dynactin [Moniliophthora roreri MCA 2997]